MSLLFGAHTLVEESVAFSIYSGCPITQTILVHGGIVWKTHCIFPLQMVHVTSFMWVYLTLLAKSFQMHSLKFCTPHWFQAIFYINRKLVLKRL
jgi:hypothetical protein